MKLLIIGNFHHKNKQGLEMILKYLKWDYKYARGNIDEVRNIDIIYSPSNPINPLRFPNKKIIFGPHFSVFPDNKLSYINNHFNNCCYIQPSSWAVNVWKRFNADSILPIKRMYFPVDVDKFKPGDNERDNVFIYFKRRKPTELNYIKDFLDDKKINYKVFDYVKRYEESDYLSYLKTCKYGIIVDAHESQGFAIQEALSCNVPLLVWNVTSMNQEEGVNYPELKATSIPYWDERCGEFFYNKSEFINKYDKFINNLKNYSPREYVLENLSVEKCSENFKNLI
tara:strand:+ start:2014 stop:2862 length:849 start_codon:yes stop_codon:yes gene_type:complete